MTNDKERTQNHEPENKVFEFFYVEIERLLSRISELVIMCDRHYGEEKKLKKLFQSIDFDFKESQLEEKSKLIQSYSKQVHELMMESANIEAHYASQGFGLYPKEVYDKISHLESVIQAADEFINLTKEMGIHYHDDGLLEAIEKYNELKKQQ